MAAFFVVVKCFHTVTLCQVLKLTPLARLEYCTVSCEVDVVASDMSYTFYLLLDLNGLQNAK